MSLLKSTLNINVLYLANTFIQSDLQQKIIHTTENLRFKVFILGHKIDVWQFWDLNSTMLFIWREISIG